MTRAAITAAVAGGAEAVPTANPAPIVAWKGFDADLKCRDYQFVVGQTYQHKGRVDVCSSGFHSCENPLDVWSYYPVGDGNRFCRVHASGSVDRHLGDSKIASETLFVETEVTPGEIIRAGVKFEIAAAKAKADDASSGPSARNASSGPYARNASSGPYATNASSGPYARNASSGDSATNEASGERAVIAAAGRNSQAKGAKGVWVSLADYREVDGVWQCCGFATGRAGYDDIPADTWLIAKDGKLVPA